MQSGDWRVLPISELIRMTDSNFLGSLTPRCYTKRNGDLSRSTLWFMDKHAFLPGTIILFTGSSKTEPLCTWDTFGVALILLQKHQFPKGSFKHVASALLHSLPRYHFNEMVFLCLDKMKSFLSVYLLLLSSCETMLQKLKRI